MLILLLLLQVIPANDMNTEGFGDFGFRSGVWYGEYMDRTCVYGKHFFFMCWCAQLMSFSMYQKSKLRSSLSKSPWLWSSQTQNFRTDVLLASCQPQVWSGNELVLICVYVNVHIPTSFTSPPPKYFRILLSLIFLFFPISSKAFQPFPTCVGYGGTKVHTEASTLIQQPVLQLTCGQTDHLKALCLDKKVNFRVKAVFEKEKSHF